MRERLILPNYHIIYVYPYNSYIQICKFCGAVVINLLKTYSEDALIKFAWCIRYDICRIDAINEEK